MPTAKFQNNLYIKLTQKHAEGNPDFVYPEARLPFAIVAGFLIPGSIFWLAWSAVPEVHWIAPILSGVPYVPSVKLWHQIID
jgi:hypothetical protein